MVYQNFDIIIHRCVFRLILLDLIDLLLKFHRSVPENQKSFALGIQWLIVRAFGTIPAAPIIGGIIDYSCVLWQDDCGEYGSCYAYDNQKMGMFFLFCEFNSDIIFAICSVVQSLQLCGAFQLR